MGNITVRKENGNVPAHAAALTREQLRAEPFRMMRDLMGWDPFGEMAPFVSQIPAGFAPSFEIKETKDSYLFKADVPGVKESALEVTLTGNRLAISGKRDAEREEQTDTFYAYERSYGSFNRAFTLPEGIDAGGISADLKDGVLSVTVKKKPEVQPKKIEIQTPTKKS